LLVHSRLTKHGGVASHTHDLHFRLRPSVLFFPRAIASHRQRGGFVMPSVPQIEVSPIGELFSDTLGQTWSAGRVTLTWPAPEGFVRGAKVAVEIVAHARAEMTLGELQKRLRAAAQNVLSDALLVIEVPVKVPNSTGKAK
jgi:hypothetical protein